MTSYVRRRTNLKRCASTGYRLSKMSFGYDESDPRCIEFKARLRDTIEALIGEGYAHFISGGALGMDMFAAEAVLELKDTFPWIVLEMVSPFDAQADRWNAEYRMRNDRLFGEADIVTATGHAYTKACMFRRNRYRYPITVGLRVGIRITHIEAKVIRGSLANSAQDSTSPRYPTAI